MSLLVGSEVSVPAEFEKVVCIGRGRYGDFFSKISCRDGRLSITGVEGPMRNGDCEGSCGQCTDFVVTNFAEGWNTELMERFRAVWLRWHLNDLTAGSPAQEAHLRAKGYDRARDGSGHYDWACRTLKDAGLQPDPNYLHNGKPYSYGSAWLREDVPADVLEFLYTLPESDRDPAWV